MSRFEGRGPGPIRVIGASPAVVLLTQLSRLGNLPAAVEQAIDP